MIGDLVVNLSAKIDELVNPVKQAHLGLENISGTATTAQFHLDNMGKAMLGLSASANSLGVISNQLASIGSFSALAAAGLGMISKGVGFVGGVAFKTASAMSLLLIPFEGLMIVANAILAPFRILFGLLMNLGRAAVMVAQPLLRMAMFAFQVKVAMQGLLIQFKLIWKFLAFLSPQLRLVVLGLTALGLAGRAGSVGVAVLSGAIKVATVAVLAFTNPLAALRMLAVTAASGLYKLSVAAMAAVRSLGSLAASAAMAAATGIKTLTVSVLAASAALAVRFAGALMGVVKWVGVLLAVGTGWGVALSAEAEQTEVAFTTMLKSAGAAKRVLGELEQFAASTPFQLKDLQDGAKQLLNAQVPTDQLTDKLRMLGDIAAGTGKPIIDFARIYAKVKATGKVSLETLNQLAERGVPIYSALASELGVSREQMLKMISSGKVGFADLDAAIASTATGTGVFAGGMKNQSTTIGGLWSTMKDNMAFAFRELGRVISDSFNFKGALNQGITFFQNLKAGIIAVTPVFQAVAGTVQAAFAAIWEIGSVVFTSLGNAMGMTGGDIMKSLMTMLGVFTFVFKSWPDIAEAAFVSMQLSAVRAFEDIKFFFTSTVPALLSWFIDNWQSIFFTAADFVLTIFINLGKNMRAVWSGILSFISGNGFNVDFTPLTEGFKSSVSQMPELPERVMSDLEKKLDGQLSGITDKLGTDMQAEIDKNLGTLKDFQSRKPEELSEDLGTNPDGTVEQDMTGAGAGSGQRQQLGIMEKGSSEAFAAIFGGANKGLAEQKKTNQHLKEIANAVKDKGNGGMSFEVQGAV